MEPACLALLVLPVSTPALAFIAEVISTARLLTVLEKLQDERSSKQQQQQQQQQQQHQASGETAGGAGLGLGLNPTSNPASPEHDQRFDELDADQRINIRSKRASQGRISARRFSRYFVTALRGRLYSPWSGVTPASTPTSPDGSHVVSMDGEPSPVNGGRRRGGREGRLLPVPLAQARTVERLGTLTMLAMVDDELVCESSFPEEGEYSWREGLLKSR